MKKQKTILGVLVVALVLAVYAAFFGSQTLCVVWLKTAHNPVMAMVPKPLDLAARAKPEHAFNSGFGCRFSVPWTDAAQIQSSTSGVCWAYEQLNIYVYCFDIKDVAEAFSKDVTKNPKFAREFLGQEGAGSSRVLFSKLFALTPKDVSVFDSRAAASTKTSMLRTKALVAIHGLYSFEFGNIAGFQLGDPSQDTTVQMYFFDQKDRAYQVIVQTRANSPVSITQKDINTIVTTFATRL